VTPVAGVAASDLYVANPGVRVRRTTTVRLVPSEGQTSLRPVRVKRISFSRDGFGGRIGRGRAGVYDIVVSGGPGAARVRLPAAFTILAPSVDTVDRAIAGSGTVLRVRGASFGPHDRRRDRGDAVTLGGEPLEILSWTGDEIVAAVGAGVPVGAQPLRVWNSAGLSEESVSVYVTPPGEAPEFLRAEVGGLPVEALSRDNAALTARLQSEGLQLLLDANTVGDRFTILIEFPDLARPTPYVLTGGANPTGESLRVQWAFGFLPADAVIAPPVPGAPPFGLTVTGWHDGVLEGTFGDGGAATGHVHGSFRVHLDVVGP
jgi:hypothetical protein